VSPFLLVVAVVQEPETRSLVKAAVEGAGHRLIACESCGQAQLLIGNGVAPDLLLLSSSSAYRLEPSEFIPLLESVPAGRVCVVAEQSDALHRAATAAGIEPLFDLPLRRNDLDLMLGNLGRAIAHPAMYATATSTAVASPGHDVPAPLYLEELGDNNFFLAASPKMLEIYRQVKLLADTDVNVLILGESGTGKEVIAQLIHRKSERSRAKFLKVNCAALPTDLLESELFGHRQGAFTGAIKDHPGKFEQADGGTLLLDEIGEISVQTQAKLLHVLQDGQFTRVGGQSCTKVNVRVLAATNIHMDSALLMKTFREDLYYRLSVFTIQIPPLRERREEIPYFIEEMIRRAPLQMRSGAPERLSSRLLDAAHVYDWPGNLRELRNFVTRMIIMRDPDAAAQELETKIEVTRRKPGSSNSDGKLSVGSGMRSIVRDLKERTEMQMILEALEASRWNRRQAARDLNISYRALLYKIQQHHLSPRALRSRGEAPAEGYPAWRSGK